jgi:beta-lactamase class A
MPHSRREFLKAAAATATVSTVPVAEAVPALWPSVITPNQIIQLFERLPGDKAVSIYAPALGGVGKIRVQYNSSRQLFVASAFKAYALCEALRQIDSPDVVHTLETTPLTLDVSIWSPGSPSFNPPNLTGTVFERAVMEAMITSSDNTATDMVMKLAGVNNIREFVSSIGLTQTLIPESTRAFAAYLFGAPDYLTITWYDLLDYIENVAKGKTVNPFLNNVETLASSADDFVSFYSRALAGSFFQHPETTNEFRRILTLCDFIYLVPMPAGVSAYAKSGNADTEDFHARSFAGGMFVSNRWVYFAFIINWYTKDASDPATVDTFFSAINQSLTLIRDSVSGTRQPIRLPVPATAEGTELPPDSTNSSIAPRVSRDI